MNKTYSLGLCYVFWIWVELPRRSWPVGEFTYYTRIGSVCNRISSCAQKKQLGRVWAGVWPPYSGLTNSVLAVYDFWLRGKATNRRQGRIQGYAQIIERLFKTGEHVVVNSLAASVIIG